MPNVCGMPAQAPTPMTVSGTLYVMKPGSGDQGQYGLRLELAGDGQNLRGLYMNMFLPAGNNVTASLPNQDFAFCTSDVATCDDKFQGTVTYTIANGDCKAGGNGGGPGVGGKNCLTVVDATFNVTTSSLFSGTIVAHWREQWQEDTTGGGSGCGSSGCASSFPQK